MDKWGGRGGGDTFEKPEAFEKSSGGSCEIRTHGGLTSSPVFKTGALNRSAKLPVAHILAGLRQLTTGLPGAGTQHDAAGLPALIAKADFSIAGTGPGAQGQDLRLQGITIGQFFAML